MIKFTPHTRADIPLRIKWLNDRNTTLHAISNPENDTTEELQNKWFDDYEEKLAHGEKKFFTIFSDETPIGFMGLSNINTETKDAKIFILIGEDEYRGKGIGNQSVSFLINYAFNDLHLNALNLDVNKLNIPAINLYKNLGFKETGEDGENKEFWLMRLEK
ncbi:MAG: GNAT family protein [bacterium]